MTEKHKWTKKQATVAQVPNFGKKYVVEPNVLKLLGSLNAKKILEFGSGNGYWLELFSKKGAQCSGIELEQSQIDVAVSKNFSTKITYVRGDITKPISKSLPKGSFDIVFLEHVLLEISSVKQLEKIFLNAFSMLKKGGFVVVSELHPFAPSSKLQNIKLPANYNYFSSGSIIKIVSKRLDGKEIHYSDFHWTLQDIIQSITKSGLFVTDIVEPLPSQKLGEEHIELAYRLTSPISIMIKATKLDLDSKYDSTRE